MTAIAGQGSGQAPERPVLDCTAQYLAWYARHAPDTEAILEDGLRVTYLDLAAGLLRYAHALRQLGVAPGEVVGLQTPHRRVHLTLALACELIGAVSLSLTADELGEGHKLHDVCDRLLTQAPPPLRARAHRLTPAWLAEISARPVGPADLKELDRAVAPERITRLARSSGTTGAPALMGVTVANQQRMITQNTAPLARLLRPRMVFLCAYQLSLRGAYHRVLGCLQQGGLVQFVRQPDVLPLIAAGMVNCAMFLVRDVQDLVRHARPTPDGHLLHVETIGAAVPLELRQRIRARLGARFATYYSCNEAGRIAEVGDDEMGVLCPGVAVRIVDDAGRDLPFGVPGQIYVRTGTMVEGYWRDPARTAARFRDGWFVTGDHGFMPQADRLVLLGRADDVLNIGGRKIAPAPFEAAIRAIPGVSDAALLRVVDAAGLDQLVVAVEATHGTAPPGLAGQVRAILRGDFAAHELYITPEFPRTETAKLHRGALAERLRARKSPRPSAGVVSRSGDAG